MLNLLIRVSGFVGWTEDAGLFWPYVDPLGSSVMEVKLRGSDCFKHKRER